MARGMTEGYARSEKRWLPGRSRRVITAAAMMAAQAAQAGYAEAQDATGVAPPPCPDCGGRWPELPELEQQPGRGPEPVGGFQQRGREFDGFVFPSFYYGFFPFGF